MKTFNKIIILSIFPLVIGCATQVSDLVTSTNYSSAESDKYESVDKIDTNLDDLIYFEFDKASLSSDSKDLISEYVEFAKNAKAIRLEGHCDERGTREYNLALGERRANAAKDYLITYGISADRISVISYGKERPVDSGSNPLSWSKNRRSVTVKAN